MHEPLKTLKLMRHHDETRQHTDAVQDDGINETVGICVSTSAAHADAVVSLTGG